MAHTTPELDQFLAAHVTSVEQLEILLLLHRSPDTYWSAEAVGQQLGLTDAVARARVRELAKQGLVVEGTTGSVYRFKGGAEVAETIGRLAEMYRERRIAVINAIYSASLTRLRTFSDAFKIGGDKS